jgi:DNA polymerase II large subunit
VIKALQRGKVEDAGKMPDSSPENPFNASKWLRFTGAASGWDPTEMDKLQPESIPPVSELQPIGFDLLPEEPIFQETLPEAWTFMQHGLLKGALLLLGIPHHHEGDDIVATCGWQALLNGFGFTTRKSELHQLIDLGISVEQRILELRDCNTVLRAERSRLFALEKERSTIRIAAETEARQRGLGISETDQVGKEAAESVPDEGPENASRYKASQRMYDDHEVDGLLPLIRESSTLRWEHAAPQRVGCRMGRPEKSAPREMSPRSHTLFPIALEGGNQRLIANAAGKGSIRVQMGKRLCSKCGKDSPFITCHHRVVDSDGLPKIGETCGGRTDMRESSSKSRRRGEMQSVPIEAILEDAQLRIGMTRLPQQVKCVKELKSKNQTPEAIEKGLIRAKYNLPVFRDGTIRFDMSDVPVTHFTPKEIYVDWKRLHALGYTHDWEGNPLERDDQMLELFPQDFIVAKNAADYFIRTAQFVDEVLVKYYKMDPYYNATTKDDLVGQLICALAPHTSGGVLSRIIGWADCSGGYAHPLFHAAKRRNCDGDEDAIMLLMDGLLNFSREILPANRGGQMDAPLVLTTRLNPTEIDKEALNVDSAWFYERQFYEATLNQPHPKDIADSMDFVERRLGTVAAVRGYGYTHDCERMDEGPELSAYKTLATMIDKMNGQLNLCQRLRAINARTVASSVIRSHFLPDLRGNLNAYGRQKIRCLKCGNSYRRMPLAGHCIQPEKVGGRGLSAHGVARSEGGQCNGKLALTVSEGAVRKYIKVTKHVMDTYGVDTYTRQNMEWLAGSVESLFSNDRAKQMSLSDFL